MVSVFVFLAASFVDSGVEYDPEIFGNQQKGFQFEHAIHCVAEHSRLSEFRSMVAEPVNFMICGNVGDIRQLICFVKYPAAVNK